MQEKLRVVLYLSARDTGLDALLRRSLESEKPYEIVGALVTTQNSQVIPILEEWGIPWQCHDIHDFCHRRGARVSDLGLRPEFDRKGLELIAPFRPSAIALIGYVYVVSAVVLETYPMRVVNLHDGDLSIMNGDRKPKYRGLHATRDAIFAGEPFTRSTVHIATDEVDAGPILVRSRPYPVHAKLVGRARELEAMDLLKAYAYAHRGWMMRDSWGELMDKALVMLSHGEVTIHAEKIGSIEERVRMR
jgi:phosphoribosylglycinamide formyltransferase 1